MSATTIKPSTKRPVSQRFDSTIDVNGNSIKRQYVTSYSIDRQQQSALFRLPYELRFMIYELAVPNSAIPYLLASNTRERAQQDSAVEPPFLQTCRLARQEALAVFYRHNDFLLPRRPSLDYRHPMNLYMNPALVLHTKASKSKQNRLSSRWLYVMDAEKIAKISTVVFSQQGRGMYKNERNEWRRDASACFRVTLLSGRRARCEDGRGFEVEYLQVDGSGRSERYAERLLRALETKMGVLAREKGLREWTREAIWDMAYLL